MTQFFKFQILPLTPEDKCWIWPSFVAKSLKPCQQQCWIFPSFGVKSLKLCQQQRWIWPSLLLKSLNLWQQQCWILPSFGVKSLKLCQQQCWIWPSLLVKSLNLCQQQCWFWPTFVAKSLKLCQQHWFGWRGVFSLKNRFSILSQQFCPRLEVIDIFWKNLPKLLNGIKMHACELYPLNSSNSKLQKWFPQINAHILHQNMLFLKATFNF